MRVERAYVAERMIRPALDAGDVPRALSSLDAALRLLEQVEGELRRHDRAPMADNAAAHRQALALLRRYLQGDPAVRPEELQREPLLEDLVPK